MDAMIPCSSLPLGVVLIASVVETRYAPEFWMALVIAASWAPIAGEAVDLMHDHEVHRTLLDVLQHPLQLRPLD